MMRLFDTHCHLDAPGNALTPAELLERARAVGVTDVLLVAVEPDNWETCASMASELPGVHLALGVHPQAVRDLDDATLDDALSRLPGLLRRHGAVAVGEIGLDFEHDRDPLQRARQESVFVRQLDVALALGLPVSLHGRKALDAMLALWRGHGVRGQVHGILHSFGGSAEQVAPFAAEGMFFGFSGSVTWTGAKRTPRACAAVPDALLLLETDAPYQPPHPLEPGPCRIDHLRAVLEAVAALRGSSPDEVAALTFRNAQRALGLV